MLRIALLFLIVALIAGVLGLSNTAYVASELAWGAFVLFLILFVLALAFGRSAAPPVD